MPARVIAQPTYYDHVVPPIPPPVSCTAVPVLTVERAEVHQIKHNTAVIVAYGTASNDRWTNKRLVPGSAQGGTAIYDFVACPSDVTDGFPSGVSALVPDAAIGGIHRIVIRAQGNQQVIDVDAARRVPEISDDVVDVDRAMRWGFGWELGPFEVIDAIGVKTFAGQVQKEGRAVPPVVEKLLASGRKGFYESEKGATTVFNIAGGAAKPVEEPKGVLILKSLKDAGREVERNSGASLIDLGDGVVCCEFHSKMNAIGADLIAMLHKGLKRLESDFDAMVIANQAVNFSVGANLMLVLVAAQEQEWDELHLAVKQFQNANLAIKYASKPVVSAPQGMALGGGCEVNLHAARIQAAAESYIGLVEAGVGLIPGGGGTKEMLIRANEHAGGTASSLPSSAESDLDLFHALRPVFETIAMAKVGTSGEECRDLGFLRREDGVSMNRDRLVADAKEAALALVRAGYNPPAASWQEGAQTTQIKVLGEQFLATAKMAIHLLQRGGYATDHDAVVARKLANILAGGALSSPQTVSEQYVLDLERDAFVSLCGEKKTQARIAHTLKTGKPLRN